MSISFTRHAKLGEQAAEVAARKFIVNRLSLSEGDTTPLVWDFQDINWFQVGTSTSIATPTFQVRVKGVVNNWRVVIHVQLVELTKGSSKQNPPLWSLDKVIVFDDMGLGISETWNATDLGF